MGAGAGGLRLLCVAGRDKAHPEARRGATAPAGSIAAADAAENAEVEHAMAAVREMERAGHYHPVKFFAAEPERLGTDPGNLIWARGAFFTSSDGRPMISFTYITALRSRVIKLRITSSDPKSSALKEFPHALGDLISRQRSKPGHP
jgi:hypothetical protein